MRRVRGRDRGGDEREGIGQGGMATVYRATDLRHEGDVSIKVLRPELAATLGPERFLQEIRSAAKLTHPHIVNGRRGVTPEVAQVNVVAAINPPRRGRGHRPGRFKAFISR